METAASRARRGRARLFAQAYADDPAVEAVLLGGSVGAGHADRYSDLELGVFRRQPPAEAARRAPIDGTGGVVVRLFDAEDGCWLDEWRADGLTVETVHVTVAGAEENLDAVLERHDPEPALQGLPAALTVGVPLHGEHLLDSWRQRAATYPDGLVHAVVSRQAQIDHFWRFEMFRERRNPVLAARALVDVHERVLMTLLALSRVYDAGLKSLDAVTERLTVAPPRLAERIREAYVAPPELADAILRPLVEETYDLVERHAPGVAVTRLRAILRYERLPWPA